MANESFQVPTRMVVLKESGDRIKINVADFDPELHEDVRKKIVEKPAEKAEKSEKAADMPKK